MGPVEERYRAAALAATSSVVGHERRTPAQTMRLLADTAEELGFDRWDRYADGGAVEQVEAEVAELLGTEAVVFFPSGVMAQQAALRVWCDRRGSTRVALPDLAHQLRHEEDGPRLLHGFRFEHLTQGWASATVADLEAVPAADRLGAVQLELPLREAGCVLPTWDELVAFSAAARALGVPLHVDGARLWESQPHLDHPLPEVVALFDSTYVSFYKGLDGLSGAALAGAADLAPEWRTWRRRMGGTLYGLTPYALSALAGLRRELPALGDVVAWTRDLAAALVERGLRVQPDPPHTNAFLLFADADPDAVTERVAAFAEREGVLPCGGWWPARAPGVAMTEVTFNRPALEHDPTTVAGWYADLVRGS